MALEMPSIEKGREILLEDGSIDCIWQCSLDTKISISSLIVEIVWKGTNNQ